MSPVNLVDLLKGLLPIVMVASSLGHLNDLRRWAAFEVSRSWQSRLFFPKENLQYKSNWRLLQTGTPERLSREKNKARKYYSLKTLVVPVRVPQNVVRIDTRVPSAMQMFTTAAKPPPLQAGDL